MASTARELRASRSRVTRHVFLLCALCSLLPTLVIGALVYTRVSAQADAARRERLRDAAKSYGLLLQERLDLTADELIGIGRRGLAGQRTEAHASAERGIQNLMVEPLNAMPALSASSRIRQQNGLVLRDESLHVMRDPGRKGVQVQLSLIVGDSSGRAILVRAEVRPAYLWNTDVVDQPDTKLCVQSDDDSLGRCVNEGPGKQKFVRESWALFLMPRFSAPGWTVYAAQPAQHVWSRLGNVLDGMPLLAAAALLVALLIGSFEARRAHRPLSELLRAFRAMARGRFRQVGLSARRDEYSALGQAFNQLSRTLRRQFRLLATLERMDQAILHRPAIEELVESMLPRLPEILDCECVGITVSSGNGRPVFCWVERSGHIERPLLGASPQAMELLRDQRPLLQWEQMPLRVAGVARGWLMCGRRDADTPRAIRRQAKGVARRFAVALRNEERERLLLRQALTDELTQLPNRRQLQEHVQRVLHEASSAAESFAFVYLDLDRFKTLNDSLGHRCGDELLFQLAATLTQAVQPDDMVARIGGDEFVLLLRRVSAAQALARLEEVQAKMREPVHVGGISIQPQASIGIAMYPVDGHDFDVLLRNADVAMYRGKLGGGGRIVYFEEHMNEQAVRRLQIESCLRQALGTNRLQLHFQPKVSLADGSLHGVEALMRWEDPGLGIVSPAEFIPVAEESELIQELGRFALERALEFCRQCMDSSTPVGHVAVNVSMLQLCDAGLVDFLQRQLMVRRIPAAMLQIEITESSIMRDAAMVREVLGRIRALGIRIAIDDFGTGYSSLAVLQHLPVDMLKIDRSFIAPIGQSVETLELVRAMLAVSRALGLESVAEGVETAEQHELLASNGCNYAQGYLYSRPVPAAAALELVRGWHLHLEPAPWIMRA